MECIMRKLPSARQLRLSKPVAPSIWVRLTASPFQPPTISITKTAPFSSTPVQLAKKQREKRDRRITLIRYFLQHPANPRPLRFSRQRALRHWTIHRAWQLHKSKQRDAAALELQKQWQCMRDACEELRLIGDDGCKSEEGGSGVNVGRLFRSNYARERTRKVPIEYARVLTEWPRREGWNAEGTRG